MRDASSFLLQPPNGTTTAPSALFLPVRPLIVFALSMFGWMYRTTRELELIERIIGYGDF